VEDGLQHAPPGKPGFVITVGEKTFAEHQSQPDLLVGSFLDLKEGSLLSDQHFPSKVGVGYQVHRARPDPEPDDITVLVPGLLHRIDQAIATEFPHTAHQEAAAWARRTLSPIRRVHWRSNHDLLLLLAWAYGTAASRLP
jgi:hypothetical protein